MAARCFDYVISSARIIVMFQVEFDSLKNLLSIGFSGHVNESEAQRCLQEVQRFLRDVQPAFRLLTNLSELDAMDLGCEPEIDRAMDLCDKAGVALVVRVIPDPQKDIGFNILSLFHYRHGVRLVTCQTLEEALKVLEKQEHV